MELKDNIRKILDYSLADIISCTYFLTYKCLSGFWGSFIFKVKSFVFGVEVGSAGRCYGPIHIMRMPKSFISVGSNVTIVSSSKRCTASSIYAPVKLYTWSPTAKIIIEDNVGLNGTSITARSKTIRIGQGTQIAPNVVIMDSDFHALWPPDNRAMNPVLETDADVLIGKNVWIGSQCLIKKGVSVGDNSVIAAGSVVAGDIPADVLSGGVPAKVIKKLP